MKNKTHNYNIPDEREQLISLKSCLAGLIFLLICLIIAFIYNVVNSGNPGWELWGFIGTCLVIIIANRVQGNIEQPKDMFNRPLPSGNTKEERRKRKIAYTLDSFMYALTFAVMDIILLALGEDVTDFQAVKEIFPNSSKVGTIALTAVFAFVTTFLIFYVFEYLIGEKYKIKRYNKMISKLDAEENE